LYFAIKTQCNTDGWTTTLTIAYTTANKNTMPIKRTLAKNTN